jgi:hypothetical protein
MLIYSCYTNLTIVEGDFAVNGNHLLSGVDCKMHEVMKMGNESIQKTGFKI